MSTRVGPHRRGSASRLPAPAPRAWLALRKCSAWYRLYKRDYVTRWLRNRFSGEPKNSWRRSLPSLATQPLARGAPGGLLVGGSRHSEAALACRLPSLALSRASQAVLFFFVLVSPMRYLACRGLARAQLPVRSEKPPGLL